MTEKQAIQAISARINGVYDDPQLLKLGALHTEPEKDIARILAMVKPEKPLTVVVNITDDVVDGVSANGNVRVIIDQEENEFADEGEERQVYEPEISKLTAKELKELNQLINEKKEEEK